MSTKLDDFYELKPCPFCGFHIVEIQHQVNFGKQIYRGECLNAYCQTEGPVSLTESGAIEKWNERVTA